MMLKQNNLICKLKLQQFRWWRCYSFDFGFDEALSENNMGWDLCLGLQSFGLCRNCCLGALHTWRLSSLQCSWCCHSSQSLEGRASKWQEKVVPRKFSLRDATISTWRLEYKGAGRPHCWTTRTQSDDDPRVVSVPLFPNSNCPSSWRCGEDGELPPPSQHDSGQWFGASEASSAICARNWTEIDKALPQSCTSRWRARGSFETGRLPKKWAPLSTIVAGIDPIHRTIMPKVPNFPEISDETPNFPGNLAI